VRDVPAIRELRFLQRLALAASSTLDGATLVNLVIAETTEATETDVCSVYLLAPDGEHLVLAATNGLSQDGVGRVRLSVGDGVTGWAAEVREPVVVPDVRAEPRFRWLSEVDQARFVAMCSVPIISGDRLVGVLNVQTDHPRDFGEGDVGLLVAIAAHVAGALERTELQGRLETRIAELHRSEEIHKQFTDLALAGAGLDAICAVVAAHAGAPVAVFDDDGERLGASSGIGFPDRLPGLGSPGTRDDARTVMPIHAGQDTLGWLVVFAAGGAEPHSRRLAIEHGATVIALDLVRERAAAEAERRLRADLLNELLSARAGAADASRLARKASRLGLRIRGRVWAVVIAPDDPEGARAVATDPLARRVSSALADAIDVPGGQVVVRGTTFVLLVPGDADLTRVERVARAAADAAQARSGGYGFSAGIGSGPGGPAELRRLVAEAEQALTLVQRSHGRSEVSAYGRMGVDRLLLEIADNECLGAYVEEWLGELIRHDERGPAAAPLVETLEAVVAEGWNLRAAARRLTLHTNTLHYRLGRVQDVCGRDLDDPTTRLALAVALRGYVLLGALQGASGRPQRADEGPPPRSVAEG
jgi:sugar diacid utilization regulator/putative methionine-R-sulfoxide reductase with GAF domain